MQDNGDSCSRIERRMMPPRPFIPTLLHRQLSHFQCNPQLLDSRTTIAMQDAECLNKSVPSGIARHRSFPSALLPLPSPCKEERICGCHSTPHSGARRQAWRWPPLRSAVRSCRHRHEFLFEETQQCFVLRTVPFRQKLIHERLTSTGRTVRLMPDGHPVGPWLLNQVPLISIGTAVESFFCHSVRPCFQAAFTV
jgi:hypothetical protein